MIWTKGYEWLGSVFIILAVVCVALSLLCFLWPLFSRALPSRHFLFSRYVSMTEAATQAYEMADKVGNAWADVAEGNAPRGANLEVRENVILSTMANCIAGKIPVYGCQLPSRKLRKLDELASENLWSFPNRASECRKMYGGGPIYTNLRVKKSDLKRVLDYLENGLTQAQRI